jgi:hypothetical protein
MLPTIEPSTPPRDLHVPVVQEGAASLTDLKHRLAPSFEWAEPRQRAMAYLWGPWSPVERKNRWPLADLGGDTMPSALCLPARAAPGAVGPRGGARGTTP